MSRLKIKNGNNWVGILAEGVGVLRGSFAGDILIKNSTTDNASATWSIDDLCYWPY